MTSLQQQQQQRQHRGQRTPSSTPSTRQHSLGLTTPPRDPRGRRRSTGNNTINSLENTAYNNSLPSNFQNPNNNNYNNTNRNNPNNRNRKPQQQQQQQQHRNSQQQQQQQQQQRKPPQQFPQQHPRRNNNSLMDGSVHSQQSSERSASPSPHQRRISSGKQRLQSLRKSVNNSLNSSSSSPNPVLSAWESRKQRRKVKKEDDSEALQDNTTTTNSDRSSQRRTRKTSSSKKKKERNLPDEEYDPYDSDPGESYREHCERIQGNSTKSCLVLPKFLKERKLLSPGGSQQVGNAAQSSKNRRSGIQVKVMNGGVEQHIPHHPNYSRQYDEMNSGTTAPPSPFQSELDDLSPQRHPQRSSAPRRRRSTARGPSTPSSAASSYPHQQGTGLNTSFTSDPSGASPASLPHDLARVRYSLRTAIGDGTEIQPGGGSAAMMERRDLRPNQIHINVSHWSDFGGRNYMEDRYAIEDMGAVQVEVSPVAVKSHNKDEAGVEVTFGQRKNRRLKMPLTWLGIFDGHGGDKASQYCSDWLSSYVRNEEAYPFDLGYAMKNAFTSIDDDFVATGQPDGSTACAATLVGGRRIVCANAGDSRAIVVRRDGTVVRLSRDHKPGMPDETRRISDLGGRVIYWGRWRVEGLLAVSRSVGDASLKPYVTAEPEVCEYDIGKEDWFLILSSDGVWDVMDNEEAAHVVIASSCVMEDGKLKIDTNRFKWAARNLCDHAKSCGSTDNFSCLVVDLKSCGNPNAKSRRYSP